MGCGTQGFVVLASPCAPAAGLAVAVPCLASDGGGNDNRRSRQLALLFLRERPGVRHSPPPHPNQRLLGDR